MKDSEYFDTEIAALISGEYELKKDHDKAVRQVQFLRDCKRYIESNPREDFLLSEQTRLKKLVKYISETGIERKFTPERIKEFRAEMGFTQARKHLEIIKFILQ